MKTVLGIAAVGLVLRIASLRGSLWYDEAFSAWLATLPADRLLAATLSDVHPPLYYGLLWLVNLAVGNSEVAVRAPSLLAGMALIFVVYRLAQLVDLGQPARLMAVGLVALAPFQIYYSTEARSYVFQMLAVSLAALGLLERRWWLLVAGSLAALYLQHTAIFFIMALFTARIIKKDDASAKPLIVSAAAIGLGFLPGLLLLLYQAHQVSGGYWILPVDSPGRVMEALDSLLFYTPYNPFTLTALATSLAVVLILADLRCLWTHQRFILVMGLLPLLLVVAVSLAWQSILIARILAPCTPFLYMMIAWVTTRSRHRLIIMGGAAAAFVLVINGAVLLGRAGRTMDAYYAIPGYQASDGIYHTNAGSIVLWRYYIPGAQQVLWQQENGLDQNLTTGTKMAMGMNQGSFEAIACRHKRWWFISMNNPTSTAGELSHARKILSEYKAQEVKTLRVDRLVDSRIYLIEPGCSEQNVEIER